MFTFRQTPNLSNFYAERFGLFIFFNTVKVRFAIGVLTAVISNFSEAQAYFVGI